MTSYAWSRIRHRAGLVPPVLAACVTMVPLLGGLSPAAAGVGAVVAIWVILVDGYTVTYGFAGQFSVGHAALWGVGAYAVAILTARLGWSFWSAIPVAVVAGCVAGALFGLPAWRLRGDHVALVTLAGGIIVQQIMLNSTFTGGADGIANISPVSIGSRPLTDTGLYLLLATIGLVCTAFTSYLKHSAIGLVWRAIKDDELAAEASGIRVTRAKILGFLVGGGFAGLAGGLYAAFNGFVSSVSFGVEQSVLLILMLLLGGVGRVWGSALAAALLTWLAARLTTLSSVSVGLTGLLMLATIIIRVRYEGSPRAWTTRLRRTGSARAPARGGADLRWGPSSATWIGRQTGAVTVPDRMVLEASEVSMSFGGVRALDKVTFDVAAGSVLAVLGQNGSGKTTLINVITGCYQPTGGRIRLLGQEIAGLGVAGIARRGVARTFQNLRLFDELTGLENVLVGALGRRNPGFFASILSGRGQRPSRSGDGDAARETLHLLGIGHCENIRAKDLSHGDRRRVEIARALVCKPGLLILDEPSAGLSKPEVVTLVAALRGSLSLGRSVLLIEHNLAVVDQLANEVLVLHAGSPIAKGEPGSVRREPVVRSLYLGLADG